MSYQQEKFTAIADNIRTCLGTDEKIKPSKFADKISEVYEAGKKSEYDEFWDDYQDYGNRTNYTGAFSFYSADIFKPKYNISPIDANYMFYNFKNRIDLVEYLGNLDITLDFCKCTNFNNFMLWSNITRLGVIDASAANSISFYFAHQLETIDRLIIKDDGSETFNFEGAYKLKNITIEGVIGKSVNIKWSPLSKNSINNVISVLSNTTTNLTLSLSQDAVKNAFSDEEYEKLVSTKTNWTISLI